MNWSEVVKQGYDQFLKHHEDLEYVVRCKNCKSLSKDKIAPEFYRICRRYGVGKPDNGFCDEGERNEDGSKVD